MSTWHKRVALGFVVIPVALAAAVSVLRTTGQAKIPHPALVVVIKDASELAVVDLGTLKVVGRVPTAPVPHEVAVSGDGKIAVVTNYGPHQDGKTLSVIDLDAQKEIHRVDLTNVVGPNGQKFGDLLGPHGIQFFQDKFYFTAESSRKIARYDAFSDKVDWTQDIGQNRTHMLVISPGGHTIYTANVNSDSVTAVVGNSDKTKWSNVLIPVGKAPEGIDISPDDSEVWAANSGDGTVSIIDTKTKKVKETVNVGTKRSNRLKFTPDGRVVLISDIATGDLVVIETATRKEVKRLKVGSSTEGILILPDGSKAYVAASGDNKIVIIDLLKFEVLKTFEPGKDPDGMAWRQ
jgi:YVTN family beta-propeller protein